MAVKPSVLVADYLRGEATITAIAGTRVYADVDYPSGYHPDNGPSLLVNVRGGTGNGQQKRFLRVPSVQLRSTANTFALARSLDNAAADLLDSDTLPAGFLLSAAPEMLGQELRHPETDWPIVLSAFLIHFKNP